QPSRGVHRSGVHPVALPQGVPPRRDDRQKAPTEVGGPLHPRGPSRRHERHRGTVRRYETRTPSVLQEIIMPEDEDSYPTESGRRRFVKGVVGASALGATAVTGAAATSLATTTSGQGGGPTQYLGIENTAGPAPRGMPQIPIEIDSDGYLKGVWPEVETKTKNGEKVKVAKSKLGGITYSNNWFQYRRVQTYSGLAPDADQDNYFRERENPTDERRSDLSAGDTINGSDFE